MKTRTVEVYRCWDDRTWDTDFLYLPHDDNGDLIEFPSLQEIIDKAVAEQFKHLPDRPCMVGVYNIPEWKEKTDVG